MLTAQQSQDPLLFEGLHDMLLLSSREAAGCWPFSEALAMHKSARVGRKPFNTLCCGQDFGEESLPL